MEVSLLKKVLYLGTLKVTSRDAEVDLERDLFGQLSSSFSSSSASSVGSSNNRRIIEVLNELSRIDYESGTLKQALPGSELKTFAESSDSSELSSKLDAIRTRSDVEFRRNEWLERASSPASASVATSSLRYLIH